MRIQIIFDPGCPWCYIGKRQLQRALALRPGVVARLSWWSFLLNPDLPPEGVDRATYLLRKFGGEARVGRIHTAIADAGEAVNIQFALDRIRRTPNTVNAHRLVRFAGVYGNAEHAVEAIFHRHFVRGLDIGDIRVLMQIGGELDLDVARLRSYLRSDADFGAVYGDNARAHRLGINGVPAFVFDGTFVICGAQEPTVFARLIDLAGEVSASQAMADGISDAGASPLDLIGERFCRG